MNCRMIFSRIFSVWQFLIMISHCYGNYYFWTVEGCIWIVTEAIIYCALSDVCGIFSQHTYTLAWTRQLGDIPWDRTTDNGEGKLTIRNVQPSDAGIYECIGSNFYTVETDTGELIVSEGTARHTIRFFPSASSTTLKNIKKILVYLMWKFSNINCIVFYHCKRNIN